MAHVGIYVNRESKTEGKVWVERKELVVVNDENNPCKRMQI